MMGAVKLIGSIAATLFSLAIAAGVEFMSQLPPAVTLPIWVFCILGPVAFWAWQYRAQIPAPVKRFAIHPAPYAILLLMVMASAWGVSLRAHTKLQNTISAKEAAISDIRKDLDGLVELAGRTQTLLQSQGVGARRLSADQSMLIKHSLNVRLTQQTTIHVVRADCVDCRDFQLDIIEALSGVKNISKISQGFMLGESDMSPFGLSILVHDNAALTPEETAIVEAFRAAKIEFDLKSGATLFPDGYRTEIVITSRRLRDQ